MSQQLVEIDMFAVEFDGGVGERVGVPVVTSLVFDREAGGLEVPPDGAEHIGRIERLHRLAPVAGWYSGVTAGNTSCPAAARRRTCAIAASLMAPSSWIRVPSMSKATSHGASSGSSPALRTWIPGSVPDDR